MPLEYRPHNKYEAKIDRGCCKAAVYDTYGVRFHQCTRKAKRDGWCTIHHPDYIAKKRAEEEARWAAEDAMRKRKRKKHEQRCMALKFLERFLQSNDYDSLKDDAVRILRYVD